MNLTQNEQNSPVLRLLDFLLARAISVALVGGDYAPIMGLARLTAQIAEREGGERDNRNSHK